jgi:hypothetical protein
VSAADLLGGAADIARFTELEATAGKRAASGQLGDMVARIPKAVGEKFRACLRMAAFANPGSLSFSALSSPELTAALAVLGMPGLNRKTTAGSALLKAYNSCRQRAADLMRGQYMQLTADAWSKKHVNDGHKAVRAGSQLCSGLQKIMLATWTFFAIPLLPLACCCRWVTLFSAADCLHRHPPHRRHPGG